MNEYKCQHVPCQHSFSHSPLRFTLSSNVSCWLLVLFILFYCLHCYCCEKHLSKRKQMLISRIYYSVNCAHIAHKSVSLSHQLSFNAYKMENIEMETALKTFGKLFQVRSIYVCVCGTLIQRLRQDSNYRVFCHFSPWGTYHRWLIMLLLKYCFRVIMVLNQESREDFYGKDMWFLSTKYFFRKIG